MYGDRRSMAPPRTPSSHRAGGIHFNVPPSGYRSRQTDFGRPSVVNAARQSMAADAARASIATGVGGYSMSGRPSAIPGNQHKRITPVPRIQTFTDERNLRDKEVQMATIQKIVRFLEDRDEPPPPFRFDEKHFLRNPSKNDFTNVFQYLFQCIEPTYQVKKIEDDALHLMNNFGYPYPLKQSTMRTMTVPTTWYQLLGVLDWLVDIVEVENEQYNERAKLRDNAQWELHTACFKKTLARGPAGGASGQSEPVSFKPEFEEYRRRQLAEHGVDSDAYDELVARRVAQEQNIKQYEERIEEEKQAIVKIEEGILDLEKDIGVLEKYREQLKIKASRDQQTLEDVNNGNVELLEQFNTLLMENAEKERQIAAQKLSGEEARALTGKRQQAREEVMTMRDSLKRAEAKVFELQPKYFKQSSKIRAAYDTFLSGLRALCESLVGPDEIEHHLAELEQCSFDQACAEFQHSRDNNKLTRLMARLKEVAEQKMHALQQMEEQAAHSRAQLTREIAELEQTRDQRQTAHQLELERAKRTKEDRQRPVVDLKHSLDMVKQRHKGTADELDKHRALLARLHDELAEKHKKYLAYKQELDSQYQKIQVEALEKMTRLGEQFQQIQDQKQQWKELGEQILAKNTEVLKEMRAEKGGASTSKKAKRDQ